MFFISSLQQQLKVNDKGFTPIQTEQGLIEIENAIVEIKKRTGTMPVGRFGTQSKKSAQVKPS